MAGQQILRELVSKRLELLAALERHESVASALHDDLAHVDATILLFIEGMSRTLFRALRMASKPLSTEELAAVVKINPKRVGFVLRYMGECGLVRREAGTWHTTY
jgi:hypothetical protein